MKITFKDKTSVEITNDSFNDMMTCSQCGFDCEILIEGYCEECYKDNQRHLDEFNARQDYWNKLTDLEKDRAIRNAYKNY